MRCGSWRVRLLTGVTICAAALISSAYLVSAGHLNAAREARRDDDCADAERLLSACWKLPGLRSAIDLEDQLAGVQQGDLREETKWQSRAAGRAAERGWILEALAKGNLAHFQWMPAQKYAESILDQEPANARALWLRARARDEMHLEEQALADLERALQRQPEAVGIRRTYADVLHRMGHVQKAIDIYERLSSARPADDRVALALAQCYQEQSQLPSAGTVLDTLLDGQPNHVSALIERARLAFRLGEPSSAEIWLRRALEVCPDRTEANLLLQLALQAQHKADSALDERLLQNDRRQTEVIRLLKERKPAPALLTEVGEWMARTGQDEDAAAWFFSALQEDSNYRPAHLGLAEFFHKNGQIHRAQAHAQLAGAELAAPVGRASSSQPQRHQRTGQPHEGSLESPATGEASSEGVRQLCGACHAYPSPETMPRWAWRKEIKQGFDFLRASALAGDFPSLEGVVQYYERRAPERLPPIEQPLTAGKSLWKFEKRGTGWMPNLPPYPQVANAQLTRNLGNSDPLLLLCESRLNALLVVRPNDPSPGGAAISGLAAPCHATVADLNADGQNDILVASLGQFFPTNDKLGQVLWLRAGGGGQFDSQTILEGVGRVADVQAADFNGDGKLDLVVAVFGWRTTGEILYLENQTTDWQQPTFARHVVDARHGAIHVPVADLNGDGRPDFVGLISQEHETVIAYLNDGQGRFEQRAIFVAPHPSYGTSGIQVVDMDGDRDLDVLLTNGDILDQPHVLKPYHGVQWLENESTFPFQAHRIGALFGASQAVAADFDGDGDQDVAAVTLLPEKFFPERERLRLPSVVLFEQQEEMQFEMHVLESGSCDHFSCAVGDWDNDGRPDLAVANFAWEGSRRMTDAATLWRNSGRQ